jgi:hypothetical protein
MYGDADLQPAVTTATTRNPKAIAGDRKLCSADIPVCRVAVLSSLRKLAVLLQPWDRSKPADKNVGDTADRNVCATLNRIE